MNNSCHAVFFTTCKTNTALQQEGEQMFQEWAHELATGGTNPTRINTCSQQTQDIDQLAIDTIDSLMKDSAARHGKQPVFNNTQLTPREIRALKRSNNAPTNKPEPKRPTLSNTRAESNTRSNTQCIRTLTHPTHVISTTASPAPISTWPDKQSMEDVPKDMVIIPENHKKKEMATQVNCTQG